MPANRGQFSADSAAETVPRSAGASRRRTPPCFDKMAVPGAALGDFQAARPCEPRQRCRSPAFAAVPRVPSRQGGRLWLHFRMNAFGGFTSSSVRRHSYPYLFFSALTPLYPEGKRTWPQLVVRLHPVDVECGHLGLTPDEWGHALGRWQPACPMQPFDTCWLQIDGGLWEGAFHDGRYDGSCNGYDGGARNALGEPHVPHDSANSDSQREPNIRDVTGVALFRQLAQAGGMPFPSGATVYQTAGDLGVVALAHGPGRTRQAGKQVVRNRLQNAIRHNQRRSRV